MDKFSDFLFANKYSVDVKSCLLDGREVVNYI